MTVRQLSRSGTADAERRGRGDLREALIASTISLLTEQGAASLSMREVARRTGVSHGAPLRHFTSFADLLSSVAARGFRLLNEHVDEAAAAIPGGAGARARLIAVGHAYVATAIEHEALFSLMFRVDLLNVANADYQRETAQSARQFMGYIRALQDDGWHREADTALLNAVVWSQVHGIASLWSHGALASSVRHASLDELVTLALDLVL
jgi:AcrR family transcriptional regulator